MTEQKESILEEAQRLIHGPRNKNYGHPRDNFKDISALFSGYLGMEITDIDVANLMILVKIARVKGTGYHRDSFTDIAGYAGCVERIYEEPEEFQDVVLAGMKLIEAEKQPRVWDRIEDVPKRTKLRGPDAEFYWDGYEETGHYVLKFRLPGGIWAPWGEVGTDFNYLAGPFTEVLEDN